MGKGIPKYILDLPEEILQTYVLLIIIYVLLAIRYLILRKNINTCLIYFEAMFKHELYIFFRPIGQALGPLIETLSNSASAGFTVGQRFVEARIQREASPEYQLLNTAIEEAR